MSSDNPINVVERFWNVCFSAVDAPVTWFREKIVEPNRQTEDFHWYHRKFPRVTDIDQCYTDDFPCIFEANEQFKRDFQVDSEIMRILRRRRGDCFAHEYPDHHENCAKVVSDLDTAEINWFIKYGDLGARMTAREAYMKQKHRLVFERRKAEAAAAGSI